MTYAKAGDSYKFRGVLYTIDHPVSRTAKGYLRGCNDWAVYSGGVLICRGFKLMRDAQAWAATQIRNNGTLA